MVHPLLSPPLMPTFLFVLQRATGLLSTVLRQSSEAIQHVVQRDVVRAMHRLLKVLNWTYSQHVHRAVNHETCVADIHISKSEVINIASTNCFIGRS